MEALMKNNDRFRAMTIAAMSVMICLSGVIAARQAPAGASSAPFPILPLIADFEYVSQNFIQFINDNPRYSMIEAIIDKADPPVYQVILNEKGSSRRVYYSNSEPRVKYLTGIGREARLAKID